MAVYTKISDTELADYLRLYDIGELHSIKGIAEGVENSNFLITTDNGPFILTLYEKRVAVEDLPFFLGLKEHLADAGFSCPRPIAMKSGETLGTLAGRPSAIISFLDGISISEPTVKSCHQLGVALGKMHLLARDFKIHRNNALTLENWRPLFEASGERANEVKDGLVNIISTELDFLENNWPDTLPSGVIHADLFPDNVFFLKEQLSGFIDFYFACNDLLAFDLATCINAWCFDADNNFEPKKANALMRGYVSERPLSREEYDALPILCRGSALRFLLTRLYDWLNVPAGALVVPKKPDEYIEKLRFHQTINQTQSYGLSATEAGL